MPGEEQEGIPCPKCGKPIPQCAPDGNCPACLFGSPILPAASEDENGERVGEWILRESIGEGAFGIVHLVEQLDPVHRVGAMKILRPGLVTPAVLSRFESECQALALLDHSNIVTIYEAGKTDDERPFLVMELIDGVPVTEAASKLNYAETIDLFDRICAAVAYAHQKGVIHRDLKPANILVSNEHSGSLAFKLLDFGIARASGSSEFETTLLTSDGQFLGTPEYMSPEQAAGDPLDVRTDVYSLGVLLYEMLSGKTPHRVVDRSVEGLVRFFHEVREGRVAPLPANPGGRDLEAITGKAMHPDPSQRYGSVTELRDDLQRLRDRKPVRARRPDRLYLAARFFQRHWKSVSTACLFAVILTGATLFSANQARLAKKAEAKTKSILAESAYTKAVEKIRDRNPASGLDHLVQSLQTNPSHAEAARLFRGIMATYEIPEIRKLAGQDDSLINFAMKKDDGIFAVSDAGVLKWKGQEYRIGGSHHFVEADPGNRWVTVSPLEGGLGIFDTEAGKLASDRKIPGKQVNDVDFLHHSPHLLAANFENGIAKVDLASGEAAWVSNLMLQPEAVAVSPDDSRAFVASSSGLLALLDTAHGKVLRENMRAGTPLVGLHSVEEDSCLLIGTAGLEIRSFRDLSLLRRGPRYAGKRITHAVSPEEPLVAIANEKECLVWNYKSGQTVLRTALSGLPAAIAIADSDRPFLAIAYRLEGVDVINYRTGELHTTRIRDLFHPVSLTFAPTGNRLFCATREASFVEIDLGEGKNPLQLMNESSDTSNVPNDPAEPEGSILTFSGSVAGKRLGYAGYRDGAIHVWDLDSGKSIRSWNSSSSRLSVGTLSPDGTHFAWRDSYRAIRVLDLTTGESTPYPEKHERDITSVVFSPDSGMLASANYEGVVRVASTSGEPGSVITLRHDFSGETARHYCRFSSDGALLLSWGGSDQAVRVWDISREGEEILTARSKLLPVSADISPKRDLLAMLLETSTGRQTIEVRSARTTELVHPPVFCTEADKISFDAQGHFLILDGSVTQRMRIPAATPVDPARLREWESAVP